MIAPCLLSLDILSESAITGITFMICLTEKHLFKKRFLPHFDEPWHFYNI